MSEPSEIAVLVAVLARHLGVISDEQLMAAAASWKQDEQPFDQWLEENGFLNPDMAATLRQLAQQQLQHHGGSANDSIGTIYQRSSGLLPESVIDSLAPLEGGDLWSTLAHLPASPSEQTTKQERPDRGGRFHKVREHAQGGLGQVFVAIDDEFNRQVALKQIQERFSRDKEARQRFLLEAEITGGLEHPGIVPVYGLGVYDDGDPYYAMRFIRGESMEEAVVSFHSQFDGSPFGSRESAKSFEFRKLAGRLVDVCQAIAYAHSRGVLHRDIKPDNIMLGKFGETLVVDWGLAKISDEADSSAGDSVDPAHNDESAVSGAKPPPDETGAGEPDPRLNPVYGRDSAPTQLGRIVGTPGFMSPEQASGDVDRLDERSDVYSLGATLYSLLVGRPAFASRDPKGQPLSVKSVLEAVREGRFEPPRHVDPNVPKPLAAICERAMAHEPDQRYASPLDLAEEIERWLSDEPVDAYDENFAERTRRWVKRHQSLTASIVAMVLVSTIGLVSFSLVLRQKNHDLQLAEAKARSEAATARAVTEFMNEDLLGQASPKDRPNPHLEVRTVLDRAAASMDQQFHQQPRVKANLLKTIGVAYGYLGEYAKSTAALTESVELYVKHLGSDSHETLVARSELGAALAMAGKYSLAEKVLREVLQRQIKQFGEGDKSALDTQAELADLFTWTGNFQEAEQLIQKAIAGNLRLYGPEHADTLSCEATLVGIWNQTLKLKEAAELGGDLLKRTEAALGAEHLHTLEILTLHAQTLFYRDHLDEAKVIYSRALDLARRLHGETHPSTFALRSDLAVMESGEGFLMSAHRTLEEVYKTSLEMFGPLHRESIVSALHLSNSLVGLQRHQEAKDQLQQALPLAEQVLGDSNSETQYIRAALAWIHYDLDELDEAVEILEKIESVHFDLAHPSDAVLESWICRASIHYDLGEFEESIERLQKVRDGYLKFQLANRALAVRANNDLLWSLVSARRFEDAGDFLNELSAQAGYRSGDLALAQIASARAFQDAEQKDRADGFVERLRNWAQEISDPDVHDLEPLYEFASLLYDIDQIDESIKIYRFTLEQQKQKLGANAAPTLDTMADLAAILEEEQRFEEAEALYRELIAGAKVTLGPHDETTLFQMELLAALLLAQEKHEALLEALKPLREGLVATNNDEGLIQVDATRATALLELERFGEAADAFGSAIASSAVAEGEEDEQMLLWLHQWAWCLQNSERGKEAIPIYQRVVSGRSRVLNALHPHTLQSLRNAVLLAARMEDREVSGELQADLASRASELDAATEEFGKCAYTIGQSHIELKQWNLATPWFQKVVNNRIDAFGDTAAATLLAMHQVAYCQEKSGKLDEAIALYHTIVKGRSQTLGETHEHTRLSLANWATIEFQRERYKESLPLLTDLLQRTIEAEGTNSLQTMLPRANLATVHLMLRQYDEAILQYRETLEIAYRRLPKDEDVDQSGKVGVAVLLIALADAEIGDERFEDAWIHAKEAHDELVRLEPDQWHIHRARSVMGAVHVFRKQYEEAIAVLLPTYAKMLETTEFKPQMKRRFQRDVAQRLALAYEGAGSPAEAEKWRRVLASIAP